VAVLADQPFAEVLDANLDAAPAGGALLNEVRGPTHCGISYYRLSNRTPGSLIVAIRFDESKLFCDHGGFNPLTRMELQRIQEPISHVEIYTVF
jgi:hypothetical protein